MHPIHHNRNQHNPICLLAIVPLHCAIMSLYHQLAIKTSCHQDIFLLSHVPSYHHIVPMSLCAILPLYHRAMCLVKSYHRTCHHPLYHCAMYHCAIVSYHCAIETLYHQVIVPLFCNLIIEP